MLSFFIVSFFIMVFLNNPVIAGDTASIMRSLHIPDAVIPDAVVGDHYSKLIVMPDAAPLDTVLPAMELPTLVMLPVHPQELLGKGSVGSHTTKHAQKECEECYGIYSSTSFWGHKHRINKSGKSACQTRKEKNRINREAIATATMPKITMPESHMDTTEESSDESVYSTGLKKSTDFEDEPVVYEDEQDLSVCAVCYEEFVTPEELEEHEQGKMVACTSCGKDINDACLDFHKSRCIGYRSATIGAGVSSMLKSLQASTRRTPLRSRR